VWIDSHCHISSDAYAADRADVLERASAAGVDTLIEFMKEFEGKNG